MIDASRITEQDVKITAATGDVANWYYRLALPPKRASYFGLGGVSATALRAHLGEQGYGKERLPDPNRSEHLAVHVLVMGWS